MDYLKTVSGAVLDCKKNVSFIVFRRVVYFMKRIYHFCCKFGIVNFFLEIFPRFIMIKIHCSKRCADNLPADNWPVDNWPVDNWPVDIWQVTFLRGRTIGR